MARLQCWSACDRPTVSALSQWTQDYKQAAIVDIISLYNSELSVLFLGDKLIWTICFVCTWQITAVVVLKGAAFRLYCIVCEWLCVTWAAYTLGNETPHEVGAVFTPVWASEGVHLRSRRQRRCGQTHSHYRARQIYKKKTWHWQKSKNVKDAGAPVN